MDHLQALARIAFSTADGAGHDCPVAESLEEYLGAFGIRREATEQNILTVIRNYGRTLSAIVFFKLREGLGIELIN